MRSCADCVFFSTFGCMTAQVIVELTHHDELTAVQHASQASPYAYGTYKAPSASHISPPSPIVMESISLKDKYPVVAVAAPDEVALQQQYEEEEEEEGNDGPTSMDI